MPKLPIDFYLRDNVVEIARDLIGKVLVSCIGGIKTSGIIVETEAYNGRTDKASHAYGGIRTQRTEVMYRQGGRAYVYLCYGIHHLFNVVTNTEGFADAVLIRAIEPLEGMDDMQKRRNSTNALTSGPGKLSQAMGIHTTMTNESLQSNTLWIESNPGLSIKPKIIATKRIGVAYAEEDAGLKWRFYRKENQFISQI